MTTLGPTFSIFQSRSWHQCYRREGFLMLTNASLQPTPAPLRGVIDCDIQEGTLAAAFPRKSPPFPSGDDTFIVPSILIIISALVFGSPPPPPQKTDNHVTRRPRRRLSTPRRPLRHISVVTPSTRRRPAGDAARPGWAPPLEDSGVGRGKQ